MNLNPGQKADNLGPSSGTCICCYKPIRGKKSKEFCSDACRKYFQRNKSDNKKLEKRRQAAIHHGQPMGSPSISAQNETLRVDNYFVYPNTFDTANFVIGLNEPLNKLLGEISHPFTMVIWGKYNQGKTTLGLFMAQSLSTKLDTFYINNETDTKGFSLLNIVRQNGLVILGLTMLNKIPSREEWIKMYNEHRKYNGHCIIYDSASKAKLNENYIYETAYGDENQFSGFKENTSHILIFHAIENGNGIDAPQQYLYDADIIVKCEDGSVLVEKNRFALSGQKNEPVCIFK